MSDVRIERVEPCEHGELVGHYVDERRVAWCVSQGRTVLSGFPPEAVEAAWMEAKISYTSSGEFDHQLIRDCPGCCMGCAGRGGQRMSETNPHRVGWFPFIPHARGDRG